MKYRITGKSVRRRFQKTKPFSEIVSAETALEAYDAIKARLAARGQKNVLVESIEEYVDIVGGPIWMLVIPDDYLTESPTYGRGRSIF